MGKYRAYESYKDSGVEWLGKIPKHWKSLKAKFVSDIFIPQRNKPELNLEEGLPWLTMDDMSANRVRKTTFKVTKESSIQAGSKSLKKGSVVASCVGNFGICAINDVEVIINQQLQAFIPHPNIVPEYLRELVSISDDYFQMVATAATVVYVNQSGFANMPVTLPPLEEQKTIARFLDYKTKQIDALIAKKEALLEKLDEKRTALISHAVTKGLDATVPMKDSGIEWLGDIPKHWKVIRQRFLISMQGGSTPSKSNPEFWDGDIPWISSKDMKTDRLTSSIDKITEQALQDTSIRLHPKGGIVIVARGMILAHSFPIAINDVDITVNQDIKIIRTILNSEYLALFLKGIKKVILGIVEEAAHGTKVLRTDLYKNIRLPVPSKKEQKEIAEYLDRKTAEIDGQKEKIQQAINLLKEYRTALITNAVTGKIDVRQVLDSP